MDNTIIQQGRFTSDGTSKILSIRSDVDWMRVYNVTIATASQTTAVGVEYYWQRGFPDGAKWSYFKSNAAAAANLSQYITSNGFTLLDTSLNPNGALNTAAGANAVTDISNAAIPVATNSGTNGLVAGDVVRLYNVTGALQLGGYDFTVGYNTLSGTTFSLDYMAQIVAATTGTYAWRRIKFNPIYYPRRRSITKISSSGTSSVVTLSVTHGYTVGQQVRFVVPDAFGMVEMNGLQGTITAINTTTTSGNTITVDIDSSAFTAFSFPLSAAVPFSQALVIPFGEDTAAALDADVNILDDATVNQGLIGMQLAGGANNPGGASSDVVYWVAGKSFSVDNQ